MEKINLSEIFDNNFDCYSEVFDNSLKDVEYNPALSKEKFIELSLSFGKQLLELAYPNAEMVYITRTGEKKPVTEYEKQFAKIDKESITDTINQVVFK